MKLFLIKIRLAVLILAIGLVVSWNRFSLNVSAFDSDFERDMIGAPPPVVKTTLMVSEAKDVLQKVNLERKKAGLSALVWEEKISAMALEYSKRMAKDDFFSHFDPDGKSIVDRAEAAELTNWNKIGENLFHSKRVASPVEIAIDGWNESKTHKENMLDPVWTHTGIGVHKTKGGDTYITQVFIQRK